MLKSQKSYLSKIKHCFSISLLFFVCVSANANDEIPIELKQQLLQGQFNQASKKLELLVAKNNAEAKYQLAILLLNGQGVTQSVERAKILLKDSSTKLPESAFLLGSLYFKGKQIPKNDKLAKHYLTIAADSGYQRAETVLRKLERASENSNRIKPQTQRRFELAITSGSLSLVIEQYLNGANLNHPNEKGELPLMTAMSLNRNDIAQWLIKQPINLNKKDNKGNTVLHIAAKLGQTQNTVALAKRIKNIDVTNDNLRTPLILAVKFKQLATAQWLINQGADNNFKDAFGKSANDYNQKSKLALVSRGKKQTISSKDKSIAKKRIAHQIKSLQAQSEKATGPYFKWPLIAVAVAQGQLDIAKQLLQNGKSPWEETSDHATAISLSLENEHYKLLDRMLKKHPIEKQKNSDSLEHLFFIAIKKGQVSLVKKLLKRANQLGLKDLIHQGLVRAIQEQNTQSVDLFLSLMKTKPSNELLGLSITEKDFAVTKQLLNKGASLNWQDERGNSPLIIAAKKSNSKAITLLIESGARISSTDKQGLTALMWATKQNCLSCAQILIRKGADPERASKIGNNAVMFAAQKSKEILKSFLLQEPDLTIRNQQSLTALMLAVENNKIDCVKLLLESGANPKRKNTKGQDSFDLAINNPKILTLLNEN